MESHLGGSRSSSAYRFIRHMIQNYANNMNIQAIMAGKWQSIYSKKQIKYIVEYVNESLIEDIQTETGPISDHK